MLAVYYTHSRSHTQKHSSPLAFYGPSQTLHEQFHYMFSSVFRFSFAFLMAHVLSFSSQIWTFSINIYINAFFLFFSFLNIDSSSAVLSAAVKNLQMYSGNFNRRFVGTVDWDKREKKKELDLLLEHLQLKRLIRIDLKWEQNINSNNEIESDWLTERTCSRGQSCLVWRVENIV